MDVDSPAITESLVWKITQDTLESHQVPILIYSSNLRGGGGYSTMSNQTDNNSMIFIIENKFSNLSIIYITHVRMNIHIVGNF